MLNSDLSYDCSYSGPYLIRPSVAANFLLYLLPVESTCKMKSTLIEIVSDRICCGQSPVAPVAGEEHVQKKSALIEIMSDGDPPMLKSVESGEQQIEYSKWQSIRLELSYQILFIYLFL